MKSPIEMETAAGDTIDSSMRVIEVRIAELRQLFNAMDPAPFRSRDLDPNAEEFIVAWGKELPRDSALALLVHLDRSPGRPDEAATLRDAIHEYFNGRQLAARQQLRALFSRGRISLAIGLAFLAVTILASQLIEASSHPRGAFLGVVQESLLIGGWVAMWRPIEIFLYDWWPIRADARLFSRLAAMPVRIKYGTERPSQAWQQDWPAVSHALPTRLEYAARPSSASDVP
ncbi:hypothetical protein [Peristeroidobacter agariperforans]|uniref:hypothetical protein n=1 Tax=Peristeroidobacter agariperforans TaxID=268404 RepID=UPI00101CCCEA|nr:hypothetical protein [Peristeroidobacter agariperforans]